MRLFGTLDLDLKDYAKIIRSGESKSSSFDEKELLVTSQRACAVTMLTSIRLFPGKSQVYIVDLK